MLDRPIEWKETLDSYRIEACWKLGSWDKLKQVLSSSSNVASISYQQSGFGNGEYLKILSNFHYLLALAALNSKSNYLEK